MIPVFTAVRIGAKS